MTEIALFTTFAAEIITSLFALIIIIITHQERAHLEREIAQAEERNAHLREEVAWLREQHTIRVVTEKPVIVVIQNRSPEVKQEEVTPEIPASSPSPNNYDPNNFPIKEEDSDNEEDNWPWLLGAAVATGLPNLGAQVTWSRQDLCSFPVHIHISIITIIIITFAFPIFLLGAPWGSPLWWWDCDSHDTIAP